MLTTASSQGWLRLLSIAILLVLQIVLTAAPAKAQYHQGGQGLYTYDDEDMTDRAVEYYMMQQQAQQNQVRQQEEFMRQAAMQQQQQQMAAMQQQAMQQQAMQQQAMQQEAMRQQAAMQQAMYEAELEAEEERYYQEQLYRAQQAQHQQAQAAAQSSGAAQKAQQVYQQQFEQKKRQQEMAQKAYASASLDDASMLSERGTLMMRDGNYLDALTVYDKCLSIQLHHLGDLHPMIAHTVDQMGIALLKLGAVEEALETFEKAVYIQEHNHGVGTHPDWALVVMHAGQAYELEAENLSQDGPEKEWRPQLDSLTEKAYELFEKALDVFQAQVPANEPDLDVANVVFAMGNIHNIREEYMEALRKFKYALETKIKLLGEDDVTLNNIKNNIGNAFHGMYKLDDAERWYKEALQGAMEEWGNDHPDVAHMHWNLALCYHTRGEVEAQKRKLNWHNRFPFNLLGSRLQKRLVHEGSDFQKMTQHLNHAFDVFVKRLGEDHISTVRATQCIMQLRELVRD